MPTVAGPPGWFILLCGEPPADPSTLPRSTLGGLIARFKATPQLVEALPGGLRRAIPPGRWPEANYPYAIITRVAEPYDHHSGEPGVFSRVGRFQVDLRSTGADAAEDGEDAAAALREYLFGPATAADPIPLNGGSISGAWVVAEHDMPDVQPERGGLLQVRRILTIGTFTAGRHVPPE